MAGHLFVFNMPAAPDVAELSTPVTTTKKLEPISGMLRYGKTQGQLGPPQVHQLQKRALHLFGLTDMIEMICHAMLAQEKLDFVTQTLVYVYKH